MIVGLIRKSVLVTQSHVCSTLLQQSDSNIKSSTIAKDQDTLPLKGKSMSGKNISITFHCRQRIIRFQAWMNNDISQQQSSCQFFRQEMTNQAWDKIRQIQFLSPRSSLQILFTSYRVLFGNKQFHVDICR